MPLFRPKPTATLTDSGNSTTAALGSSEVFTGTAFYTPHYGLVTVFIDTDQAGTLSLQFSTDGTNWDRAKVIDIPAGGGGSPHTLIHITEYFRVVYTNGATAQGHLRIQTRHYQSAGKGLTSSRDQTLDNQADVELVRVVNTHRNDVARGLIADVAEFHRFGVNPDVGTSAEDIWQAGGFYPWPTTAETLRIRAGGNAADDSAGAGARSVVVQFLDSDWAEQQETLTTAGASASSPTTLTARRVIRAYVEDVGAYTGDNAGDILIENSTSNQLIAQIGAGLGQTLLSQYTVPAGKTAVLTRVEVTVDSTKDADVTMYQRQGADVVAAPFKSRRVVARWEGLTGDTGHTFESPPTFPEKTDLWFEGVGSATGTGIAVEYDLILVDN